MVYAARDQETDGAVALKTLVHMSPMGIYRLKQEFRVLASLSHPNFVLLHELISTGGIWFITMELVAGVDFVSYRAARRRRSPFIRVGISASRACAPRSLNSQMP